MNEIQKIVVCAAIRKVDVTLCGARHFDSIMRSNIKLLGLNFTGWEQGFIDQFGNFLTREEAWIIADKAGQIRRPTGLETTINPRPANIGDKEMLFSENLY